MKRILMTGATGFMGSRLLISMLEVPRQYHVTILKRSFSNLTRIQPYMNSVTAHDLDRDLLEAVFAGQPFDSILHCATDYGRGNRTQSEVVEANLLLPLRLLELGLKHGTRVFLNTDTMLEKNVSGYTLSKRQFRDWLQCLSSDIVGINIALEHFYGPGDNPTKFVSDMIARLAAGAPSIALTTGIQRRDFVYIDDVVDATMCILRHAECSPNGYVEYEVGSGVSTSVREFVELAKQISKSTGTHLEFGAVPFRRNEPMDVHVDISRLCELGWSPRWSLRDGLEETLQMEKLRQAALIKQKGQAHAFPDHRWMRVSRLEHRRQADFG